MTMPRELAFDECVQLLQAGDVGRVALMTPGGPQIVPVNYAVAEESVVVATSPYSALGTYGVHHLVAFEIDHVDHDTRTGWSVTVRGRAVAIADPQEVRRLRETWAPRPWADGNRSLHLRIPWTEISGRSLGGNLTTPVRRVATAS